MIRGGNSKEWMSSKIKARNSFQSRF